MYKKKGHDFSNYYMRSIAIKKRSQSQYNMFMNREILKHNLKEDKSDRKTWRIVSVINALEIKTWITPVIGIIAAFTILMLWGLHILNFPDVFISALATFACSYCLYVTTMKH